MPKEYKPRGRWAEKKRKRQDPDLETDPAGGQHLASRDYHIEDEPLEVQGDAGDDYISFAPQSDPEERPFYGLLDPQEQEYYASVNAKLELNDFDSADDKQIFLDAVYRESKGKELKIASSQACSRCLERLILASSGEQVRDLFGKFVGHFSHLVQHRFASHCCEGLFLKAAQAVEDSRGEIEHPDSLPSLEQLFLTVTDELEPHLGYLLTERFASHVVRILMLVLSGEPLDEISANSVLASRKKERIQADAVSSDKISTESRLVPDSFKTALGRLIAGAVSGLDTTYIRALATHPTGNPILQLLLRLELAQGGKSKAKDSNSVIHRLIPDESLEEGGESSKFIQGLLYDPTGSRLLETIIQHAPGKIFEKLYGNLLKHRMSVMVKNEIAGYVAIRILERLGREDLQCAREAITPEISTLVVRNRIKIVKVLMERCEARHVDVQPIVSALESAYGGDTSTMLANMLRMQPDNDNDDHDKDDAKKPPDYRHKRQREAGGKNPAVDIHGSLLAQALLQSPAASGIVHRSLQSLPPHILLSLAKDPSGSRVIQQALRSPSSSHPYPITTATIKSNRKLIPNFYGQMAELATDPSGSHLADALWHATTGSHFIKERLALELSTHKSQVRDSNNRYGRRVWRNWSMDTYQRRPAEWHSLATREHLAEPETGNTNAIDTAKSYKSAIREFQSVPEKGWETEKMKENKRGSALDIARHRFVTAQRQNRTRNRNHSHDNPSSSSKNPPPQPSGVPINA